MSALDNLPPDQRAVLQMVLQRGRSYDEIANMLSIERSAVRQRALDAFDAIAPAAVIPGPGRALVTDYLLDQVPDEVAEQVYAYMQASDSDREWALAVAAKLAPLTSRALPEIPVGAPLGADARPDGGLEQHGDPPAVDAPASRQAPPSSRRGGAILLGAVAVMIVIAVIVAAVTSGGSSKPKPTAAVTTRTTHETTTRATPTASAGVKLLAALNLVSPTGAKDTVGIAQVIRKGNVVGVVVRAQGMPANTTNNAYAVWLYNSASSHRFVGFVPNLVGKSGRLATEGQLPADAASFHRILITLETRSKPTSPGEVVLSGPFSEHS